MRKIGVLIFCILMFISCNSEGDRVYYFKSTSYVCEYWQIKEDAGIYLTSYTKDNNLNIKMGGENGGVSFTPDNMVSFIHGDKKNGKKSYDPQRHEMYMDLCKKHEDLDYVRKVRRMTGHGFFGYVYYDLDPVKLDIVSDADFDEKHPAGTSLGDLFYFNSVTPYPFIKNGYQGPELTRIKEKLDKITPEDMVLSIHNGVLVDETNPPRTEPPFFSLPEESLPTISQQHTFTITIVDDYDRTFTGRIEVDFTKLGK